MDKIVYLLVTNGGGMDGMDHTDKGGKVMDAKWHEHEIKLTPWTHLEKQVLEVEAAENKALHKLTPLDKLVLNVKIEKPFITRADR